LNSVQDGNGIQMTVPDGRGTASWLMKKVPITRHGHHRLLKELTHLRRVVRPEVLDELREARAFGVKTDNQQYLLARERHLVLEKKIYDLEKKLSFCEVFVGRKFFFKQIGFGTRALIQNIDTGENYRFQMVGPYESDVSDGKLSIDSPLGSCLMGRFEGEDVTVFTPAGIRLYRILEIEI
jgi:transcription elongation factor GreA